MSILLRPETDNLAIFILKHLTKYPVTLFILLLVVYTQVFAHWHTTNPSTAARLSGLEHVQTPAYEITGVDGIYFEEVEEDWRTYSRECARNFYPDFLFAWLPDYFFHYQNAFSSSSKYFLTISLSESPDSEFRVLRL